MFRTKGVMEQSSGWHEIGLGVQGKGGQVGECVHRYSGYRVMFSDCVSRRGMGGGVMEKFVWTNQVHRAGKEMMAGRAFHVDESCEVYRKMN